MRNAVARGRSRPAARRRALGRLAAAAFAFVLRLEERRRQRLHLSELDDHLLADIGLTRRDVEREGATSFWR